MLMTPYPTLTSSLTASTIAEFRSRIAAAKSGDIIYLIPKSTINFNGTSTVTIPPGVTIASDRTAILKKSTSTGGWKDAMLTAGGKDVRITGCILEGEMLPQDSTSVSESMYLKGITDYGHPGFEIDNCEIRGWSYAGVFVDHCVDPHIHHCYIHHNQVRGEGYGVNVNGGNALVEANLFDNNRHSMTGGGLVGETYEFRYNVHLGHGNCIGGCHVDVHENEKYNVDGIACAGTKYLIHHNTFRNAGCPKCQSVLHIRDNPQVGVYFENNLIEVDWGAFGKTNYDGAQSPVYQTMNHCAKGSHARVFCKDNKWRNGIFSGNEGLLWKQ
jgi:hypothetical protein